MWALYHSACGVVSTVSRSVSVAVKKKLVGVKVAMSILANLSGGCLVELPGLVAVEVVWEEEELEEEAELEEETKAASRKCVCAYAA